MYSHLQYMYVYGFVWILRISSEQGLLTASIQGAICFFDLVS